MSRGSAEPLKIAKKTIEPAMRFMTLMLSIRCNWSAERRQQRNLQAGNADHEIAPSHGGILFSPIAFPVPGPKMAL